MGQRQSGAEFGRTLWRKQPWSGSSLLYPRRLGPG